MVGSRNISKYKRLKNAGRAISMSGPHAPEFQNTYTPLIKNVLKKPPSSTRKRDHRFFSIRVQLSRTCTTKLPRMAHPIRLYSMDRRTINEFDCMARYEL